MKNILQALNTRPIAYYPIYRKITGSTTAGILLSQLMFWFSKKDKVFKTNDELISETMLTIEELKKAKKAIKKLDFIIITLEGIPAKTYYEIDWEKYETCLCNLHEQDGGKPTNCVVGNPPTVKRETHQLCGGKNTNSEVGNPPTVWWETPKLYRKTKLHTENTTKTTTKTTTKNTNINTCDDNFSDNLIKFKNTKAGYDFFIEYLKKIAPIKSKITSTKTGLNFYKTIDDKEKLISDYISHQKQKREFAVRITAFMEDYNSFILPQQTTSQKFSDKVQAGLGAVEAFLADDSIGGVQC